MMQSSEPNSGMTYVKKISDEEFKIIMTSMLKTVMEKVGNISTER